MSMKITQVKIGLEDFHNIPIVFVKDQYNYFAEAIEDQDEDRYYYRIDGVTIEIEKWEYDRVIANPRLYYFSTALKLHHRIRRAQQSDTQPREHNGPPCVLKKTPVEGPDIMVAGSKAVPSCKRHRDVLILTADASTRDQIRELLEQEGYGIWTATDGIKGMLLCRFLLPDLVITDLALPLNNGFNVIEEIQELFEDAKMIAVSTDQEKLDQALRVGAQEGLLKPVKPEDLLNVVRHVIGEDG